MTSRSKDVKDAKDVKTSHVSRRHGIVLLAFFTSLASFTSLLLAQQTAPIFRSKVEIVQLDVSVLDKHRQPVRGLLQSDFTILEDGKPQKIVGFSAFDVDDDAPPATGWMRDVPPDITTNDLKPESRLFVIVMDDAMIPQEPFSIKSAKSAAKSIIDKLGADDLTAIVFTGDNRKTQDFTSDKTKLVAALDKFNPGLAGYRFGLDTRVDPPLGRGGRGAPPPTDSEPLINTDLWFYQSSVRTLSQVADYLIAVPNRRKALFWVSPGVPMDFDTIVPRTDADIFPESPLPEKQPDPMALKRIGKLPPESMMDLSRRTDEVFRRAQRANVTVYPIDPTGLGGLNAYLSGRLGQWNQGFAIKKATAQQDFLAAAAANTGGRTVMNTNDLEPGITGIFVENASYYLIGFERADTAADGKLHKLQVKVNREDVDVRTRSGYYAPEPEKPNKKLDAMTPEAAALAKAMSGILPATGMPLRASVAPFAVPGQRLSTVTVVLGVKQPIPASAANGRITETTELLTSAFTPEGDPRGAQKHTAKVVLRPGANGEAAYEVLARIDLPAGRYQLRLAAHNSTAATDGAVFVDVTVPDYSNIPFSASPVVLGASPGRVSAPKDLFSPLLPLVPTAEREFTAADKVTAFLRLYQSGQKPVEKVQLTIRIRDAQDQLKINETQMISADQFPTAGAQVLNDAPLTGPPLPNRPQISPTPTPASKDAFANLGLRTADIKFPIPMSKLAPGPHLLTLEATLGTTTIRRDVRFQVK